MSGSVKRVAVALLVLLLTAACGQVGGPGADVPQATPSPAPVSCCPAPTDTPLPASPLPDVPKSPSAADLEIEVPELLPLAIDETSIYTVTVHNHGPGLATGIVVTDVYPSGVRALWIQDARSGCEWLGRDVDCDLGHLVGGDQATVTLDLSAIEVKPVVPDPRPSTATTDLATPTCRTDPSASPPHTLCRVESLDPGASAQVRIGLVAEDAWTGALSQTVTVTANEPDPDRSNNSAQGALTAESTGLPDLSLHASGPSEVTAGRPFTYTYTITNQGAAPATHILFEDVIPSDLDLVGYAPGLPQCEQQGNLFTCRLSTPSSTEPVTFTLALAGQIGQPARVELDPLQPGWPVCLVVKERTWRHIVQCEIGALRTGQVSHVQLVLVAIGTRERTTDNTASVEAGGTDLNPVDNTTTTTITVRVSDASGSD